MVKPKKKRRNIVKSSGYQHFFYNKRWSDIYCKYGDDQNLLFSWLFITVHVDFNSFVPHIKSKKKKVKRT